jgi:hypothetical protein
MLTSENAIRLALGLIGAAFGAGGAAFQMRRATRDLNGLGKKYYRMAALLVRWADTGEKRAQAADLIEGK